VMFTTEGLSVGFIQLPERALGNRPQDGSMKHPTKGVL
jgi:hypothetical protein